MNESGRRAAPRDRRGLTLAELLVASAIMTFIAGGMGMLVMAVHGTNDYCRGQGLAAQHGRVAIDRIQRCVRGATASEQFPGCLVVTTTASGWNFPDTLVVWSPTGTAADPAGLPRVSELCIFTPDATSPNRLLELRAPTNSTTVPAVSNATAWANLVSSLKSNASTEKIELTDRLRTAAVAASQAGNLTGTTRGCMRFHLLMAPTAKDWADYRAGSITWNAVQWPLDFYSSQTGMRRVVCWCELQILPGDSAQGQVPVPMFGSATLTCELSR